MKNEFLKPFYKKSWFMIVAGFFIMILLIGILNKKEETIKYDFSGNSKPELSSETTNQPIQSVSGSEIELNEPNVGVIKKTNTILRVIKYEDNADIENQFVNPKPGYKYLAFQIQVDNSNGKEALTLFTSGSFKLKDDENDVYDAEAIVGKEPLFHASNKIDVGDGAKGWVTFEVPEKTKYNKCKLKYDFLGTETNWIELK